jgi:hypothetical protein
MTSHGTATVGLAVHKNADPSSSPNAHLRGGNLQVYDGSVSFAQSTRMSIFAAWDTSCD